MTDVELCQMALGLIGSDLSISALDDGTLIANKVKLYYATSRRAALRGHFWNFAIKRLTLTPVTAPASGFTFAYLIPRSDPYVLRVLSINENPYAEWQVEGNALVTFENSAIIKCLIDIENPTLWDDLFIEAFPYRLASSLAVAIKQDTKLGKEMLDTFNFLAQDARAVDGQEGTGEAYLTTDLTSDIRWDGITSVARTGRLP